MSWDTFLNSLGEWFERRSLLRPGARWVIGVSGGADSTALLHAMRALSEKRQLDWALHVAHFHHGLRDVEADEDLAFVKRLAQQFDLPLISEHVNIRGIVKAEGGSTEEVARRHRYEFLERAALRTGSELVAVAHHADDDAETILHRICRGTGMRGLAGMRDVRAIQPGSRIRLVRPFLHQKRATIEQVCHQQGIEWRQDSTNLSPVFTRGKIRNIVMPILREQLNPHVSEAILRLAEQARWFGNYLEDAAARTFESIVISENRHRIVLNNHALLSKQRIVQAELVRRTIALVTGSEGDVSYTHVDDVLRLAAELPSGKELHLPGPLIVRKVYDRLEFQLRSDVEELPELTPIPLNCPGVTPLAALSAELLTEVREVDAGKIAELRQNPHPYEEWLDFERLQLPLYVRSRRVGDRFWPLGAPGSKTLAEFFSDEKIDPLLRARMGIVCDQVGPAWVMPVRIDERVKLRATTRRALRLVLTARPSGDHASE